jgi:hypothetical protein
MPKPIGPTIPRWQLGEQLARLRDEADLSQTEMAVRLGCSVSKIQKIEAGDVGIVRAELLAMLDAYDATEDPLRAELLELQRLGKQRGWWSTFGQLPTPFTTLLGMESAATSIRVFEPTIVYGLLQTRDYATALTDACHPDLADADRQWRIRRARQERVFADEPPAIHVVLDEAVLRRHVGSTSVMRAQLESLLAPPKHVSVQIVPFSAGGYPGQLGSLVIFEFPERLHSPVAYAETQAGNLYMEKEVDITRSDARLTRIIDVALSRDETAKLILKYLDEQWRSS